MDGHCGRIFWVNCRRQNHYIILLFSWNSSIATLVCKGVGWVDEIGEGRWLSVHANICYAVPFQTPNTNFYLITPTEHTHTSQRTLSKISNSHAGVGAGVSKCLISYSRIEKRCTQIAKISRVLYSKQNHSTD